MADYIPDNGWGGLSKYQYEDHRHMPLFLINGMIPPDNVRYGYTESTEQLVKSQRNSKGVVVAKKVGEAYDNSTGKRLLKFDGLEWPILPNSDYRWLQEQIEKFYCYLTFYDARAGYQPMGVDPFSDNTKNLIDCGEPYLEPGDNNWVNPAKFGPPYEGKEQWPTEY